MKRNFESISKQNEDNFEANNGYTNKPNQNNNELFHSTKNDDQTFSDSGQNSSSASNSSQISEYLTKEVDDLTESIFTF